MTIKDRTQHVGSHRTAIKSGTDSTGRYTEVIYCGTSVVCFYHDGVIILNSGDYRTQTTKARMNQASNQYDLRFRVYQKNNEWFVEWKGETIPFTDMMELV